MKRLIAKLLPDPNEKEIKKLRKIVERINFERERMKMLSDDEIRGEFLSFWGQKIDENVIVNAFALIREAGWRILKEEAYDVQLIGALALHRGSIAEMKTGEGKTLVTCFPLALHALQGRGVHAITANEYLATRDAEWMGKVYTFLGLRSAALTGELEGADRKNAYAADITYGTSHEFGFDYLRDNMAMSTDDQVQNRFLKKKADSFEKVVFGEPHADAEKRNSIIAFVENEKGEVLTINWGEKLGGALLVGGGLEKSEDPIECARREIAEETGFVDVEFVEKLPQIVENNYFAASKNVWRTIDIVALKFMLKSDKNEGQKLENNEKGKFTVEWNKKGFLAENIRDPAHKFIFEEFLREKIEKKSGGVSEKPSVDPYFALIDEIDSILIDEARTPMILSAPSAESSEKYVQYDKIVKNLVQGTDFTVKEKERAVLITDAGIAKIEKILGIENIYTERGFAEVHHLEQSLRANVIFVRDRHYLVTGGKIVIVDEHTGRAQPGRRFSAGLHQAIEAKEGVEILRESITLAEVTVQNYFRRYSHLCGCTGTAKTEEEEFGKIYGLPVLAIPTHRPIARVDAPDAVFRNLNGKIAAVVREVKARNEKRQPVLVGTASVQNSEIFAEGFRRAGVKHEILNAKNHEREAEIIANAGQNGAVTIATNMAGRGTDIKLGEGVEELGGLAVICTERHEARRIDDQLRGRAGRQGDRGYSQFFCSLDDDLLRVFGGGRVQAMMNLVDFPEDRPLQNKMLHRALEGAQKRLEGQNFDMRRHLVEYDDVNNKHREIAYKKRQKILEVGDEELEKMVGELLEKMDLG